MICAEALHDYGLRAIGIGERLLPKSGITLCEQTVLIASGLLWNLYFGALALLFGFVLAQGLALARAEGPRWLSAAAGWFIYLFRGSPLFIQFFLAYEAMVMLPDGGFRLDAGIGTLAFSTDWFARAWLGALIVLVLNTSAYSAEIFHGALMAVPRGDLEAAAAYGMSGWTRFRRIQWPTMLRLAWPAYTNEAIFLFHATTLVFFSGFPAYRQEGDALYYAKYFAEKTFNPFVPYPIVAALFVLVTLGIIALFGAAGRRLNRHLPSSARAASVARPRPTLFR